MKINFGDIGASLGSRILAHDVRKRIEISLRRNDFVVFDFSNVEFISHSFADECFGKLLFEWKLDELKEKSTFKNTNQLINRTIALTLTERLVQLEEV